ncbi:uncharacterized protein LOC115883039 isoform X2 [Sitophilus oryzae]|uniref:Uncharacterized protein LOC115883039 isoform X2 n=1 Tax=Sitophilus oryzae TaxID=7048 RepID=A0A6J2Y1K3_SITOR|nr:uncharacterized protein LOC115883039 isoform X2 [Sitophilus oryzae]
MEYMKTEEKSPLLLYVTDGEESLSKNNKRLNCDKGRLYGISSGATTVFTDFPNYVSPCWLTAILSGLIFFMMFLLTVSSIGSVRGSRLPRCAGSYLDHIDNRTIHLVHDSSDWSYENLDILQRLKDEYSGYHVHILNLKRENVWENSSHPTPTTQDTTVTKALPSTPVLRRSKRNKRNLTTLKRRKRDQDANIAPILGVKSLLDILLNSRMGNVKMFKRNDTVPKISTLMSTDIFTTTPEPQLSFEVIAANDPNLTVENVTVEEAFENTLLERHWIRYNPALIVFSLRVLRLWEFGGLTFKLDQTDGVSTHSALDSYTITSDIGVKVLPASTTKLLHFIKSGRSVFENLPQDVVTADDEGIHMFTKTPCHAFFGEVLFVLKKARGDETVKTVIQRSLEIFCLKSSMMARKYCKNFIKKGG